MNPLSLILAATRSGAHKSGMVSAAEAVPGALAAYVAILLAGRAGSELSSEEILAVYTAGPAISSYILGILRKLVADALRAYRAEFPKGLWKAGPDPDRPGKTAWFVESTSTAESP